MKNGASIAGEVSEVCKKIIQDNIPAALHKYCLNNFHIVESAVNTEIAIACLLGRSDVVEAIARYCGELASNPHLWTLLAQGPDPQDIRDSGITGSDSIWLCDRVGVARILLEHGQSVHGFMQPFIGQVPHEGHDDDLDPLFLAVDYGQFELSRFLLENGADPFTHDAYSALRTIDCGRMELYWHLLSRTENPDLRDELMMCMAASSGLESIVVRLLEGGVDPDSNLFLKSQGFPVCAAIRNGHDSIAKMLVEHHTDIRTYRDSIRDVIFANGRIEFLEWITTTHDDFGKPGSPEWDDSFLDGAIREAVDSGNLASLDWLAAQGVQFKLEDCKVFCRPASPDVVHWIVSWLLSHPDVDWNQVDGRNCRISLHSG